MAEKKENMVDPGAENVMPEIVPQEAISQAYPLQEAIVQVDPGQEAAVPVEPVEKTENKESLSQKQIDFAKHLLQVQKGVQAVYIVDGLYFTDKKRAEGRAAVKGGNIHVLER